MGNWWFGLVVWIPGIPLWKGLLLGGTPRIPKHRAPNHQFTIRWDGDPLDPKIRNKNQWMMHQVMCHLIGRSCEFGMYINYIYIWSNCSDLTHFVETPTLVAEVSGNGTPAISRKSRLVKYDILALIWPEWMMFTPGHGTIDARFA